MTEPGANSVRNSGIAKFGTRDERKTKLTEYINRRGIRNNEKSAEAKILSHKKELKRIQKGDRKMKRHKRDTASGISSNRSNFSRARRVRMPKVPLNLAPPGFSFEPEENSFPQVTDSQLVIAPPSRNQSTELMIPSTSAPLDALHQVRSRTTKRAQKSPKYLGFENDDSSRESTKLCPPNPTQPRRKRCAGDFQSVQSSVVQTIVNTPARVEPIHNPFPPPIIGEVSSTDPCIRPSNQSPPEEMIIGEEDM